MNEILAMALEQFPECGAFVLVVERGDAKTLVLGTDNPRNRLIAVNAWSPLEHHVVGYATEHYAAIAAAIGRRYRALSEDGFGLWFHVDAREICAAIEEFDLATGVRARDGVLELNGRVWVKGLGPGVIAAFTERGGRVKLARPVGELREVLAPRALMKPYLRAVA